MTRSMAPERQLMMTTTTTTTTMTLLMMMMMVMAITLPTVTAARKQPHILFILADDWGWHDVSWAQYADLPTPHLASLRQESLELMQFYTQHKCTPARAALMTGRYPYKMGLQTSKVFNRVHNNTLDPSYKLLPAYLKDLGYRTHMAGKWHLGFCNHEATPIGKGFDTHYGSWANLDDRFHHTAGRFNLHDLNWNNKPSWEGNGTHTVHLLTAHTQHMLTEHFEDNETKDKPVFMYLPYLVPHLPSDSLDHYMNNTDCNLIENEKRRIYCGMVAAMDEGIGNITRTLTDLGKIDDFIIFITSDNGGAVNVDASNFPLRGNKQTIYEGGTRVRTLLRAPKYLDGQTTGQYNGLVHIVDMLPTLYTAAGGSVEDLPSDKMDGQNMWGYLKNSRNTTSRDFMVYNIDSSVQQAAIRYKNASMDLKLVWDNAKKRTVGYRYQDPRPKSLQRSDRRRNYYSRASKDEVYFLYDLATNPSEVPYSVNPNRYPNAALTYPAMYEMLIEKLKREIRLFEKEPVEFYPIKGNRARGAYIVGGC